MFQTLLIANRGEIACRVIRTCRRLGIRTVAVYSDADRHARHVRLADVAIHIGGSAPAESYLRGDAIIEAARRSGAGAIHPGYGFLSENADFAEAVEAAGLVFVGPKASSMRRMGSKAGAKELMAAAGVPVVPGYTGVDQDPALLQREADRIGYPLMIKAAHGGGGKGMRVVRTASEFAEQLASCQREAKNAFGRERVLLERYIESPRHIEIQVFGDAHGHVIHLNERECSAQRRYQKILEESPSPFLTPELRAAMGDAAVQAARAIDYVNAGTVEFIVDAQGCASAAGGRTPEVADAQGCASAAGGGMSADAGFYFMEINTRLQVEHPVTELVTGLDLVEWQLRVAAGEPLPRAQSQIEQQGHAIEVRLYAEDPERGFLPGSGRIERLLLPEPTSQLRIDAGVDEGDTVSVFYDPMIAKLIVHGADRRAALAAMAAALRRCDVVGPASNVGFLERLIAHPAVVEARIDTGYLDRHLDSVLAIDAAPPLAALAAAVCLRLDGESTVARREAQATDDPSSPWALADGWRVGHASARPLWLEWRDQRIELAVIGDAHVFELRLEGDAYAIERLALDGESLTFALDGEPRRMPVLRSGEDIVVHDGPHRHRFHPARPFGFDAAAEGAADRIRAPMPGRIVAVQVTVGDAVQSQQAVIVMEAMKMELTLRAPQDAVVAEVRAAIGEFVEADTVLIRFGES